MSRLSVWRSRFFWKVYLTFALLFLGTTVLVNWLVVDRVREAMKQSVFVALHDKAALLVPAALAAFNGESTDLDESLRQLSSTAQTRITLIATDGRVLADSSLDAKDAGNHLGRPEIQTAIAQGVGHAERYSQSLNERMLYVARAVKDGDQLLGIVRVALAFGAFDAKLASTQKMIVLIVAFGSCVALATGWRLTRKVAVPITEMMQVAEGMRLGKYEKKVTVRSKDEIGRLGETLNSLGTELTKQITELKRLEGVRRDFVANVSHEIKTPLTSIKGYVETLMSGAVHDPNLSRRFLEKIERNANRLSELVHDILSLAKIESQEAVISLKPTEWGPIAASVLARYEDSIQQKGLKVKVNDLPAPLVVMGDKEAMTQVLDNLLTNAVKYTPAGGRISVTLSQKNRWGKVEVEDTGIGIPAQYLDRIFERFYRVDKARSRDMGGTGLGLSIVKHLVSGMGGEISVDSQVGVGSRFTIRLQAVT